LEKGNTYQRLPPVPSFVPMMNERSETGTDGARRGPGQISAPPRVDADVAAIEELEARIRLLWSGLAVPVRDYLGTRMALLSCAMERRETDSRDVRAALQQVLLNLGTGAVATLSDSSRERLTALTGIALPAGYGEAHGQ
jgi:hypothetical protein